MLYSLGPTACAAAHSRLFVHQTSPTRIMLYNAPTLCTALNVWGVWIIIRLHRFWRLQQQACMFSAFVAGSRQQQGRV
jgi:hypothetical protein